MHMRQEKEDNWRSKDCAKVVHVGADNSPKGYAVMILPEISNGEGETKSGVEMEFSEIMDSDQAARFLRCSRSHVQSLARNGIVPANRAPNGRWCFSRAALIAWAAGEKLGVS